MTKLIFYLSKCEKIDLFIEGKYEKKEAEIPNIFLGKKDEICFLPSLEKKKPHRILAGLGKEESLTLEKIRNVYAKAIQEGIKYKVEKIEIEKIESSILTEQEILQAFIEGINLGKYKFDKYKTKKSIEIKEMSIYIKGIADTKENRKIIEDTKNLTNSINEAKDLILEPSNKLYPEEFALHASKIAKESGFEIEVMETQKIKELGMDAFLTVGKGTLHKPRLLVMRYLNGEKRELIGLVGKGLTCDTGGYCLKSSESLKYIKTDMSGAACVLSIISALAKNKCKTNVVGVAAVCENTISEDSYKPGDIITSMSGKTIEVINTDAEGRLTLADALYYIIKKEKVKKVIDIATLTGTAGITFGNFYTPFFSNNKEFQKQFLETAKKTEEYFWLMPSDKRYLKLIQSDIADLKNTAEAGTITAALFLQEFVQDVPWIHLDIAATAVQQSSSYAYIPNGPSGVAIRTIYELIK